jgi:serine/threonine-protein kinase
MNERDLFTAALHQDDAAAYLQKACADEPLRRRVEALLEAHRLAGAFLEGGPAIDAAASGLPSSAGASVLRALAAGLPALPRVCLRDPVTEDHTPVSLPGSPELPDPAPAGEPGRYQLVGEIARGGMGAVLKGRDTDLGRDVAVKVLLDAHKDKVELLQRFVEEAQVGGQLQHPGIVPVYELGQFPDRRPFFAMKLVKGRTLSKLLRERPSPAADLPRFVQIFAQVCQAVGYAHARGVIHRDLKPANVMVGSFGEVQVMDWGLAKVLRQGGVADEAQPEEAPTQIRTVRSAGSSAGQGSGSDTRAGSVLGTPAYMAPEQANAEVDRLDERADVFGLGAILCAILTGQPPYTGRDGEEVYKKAAVADTAEALARLDGCGADAELIILVKRCLTADPAGRPRDAGAVAGAVTTYQESVAARLRQAELAHAAEAARAEEAKATAAAERRARRLTRRLAASLLLLVAVGAAGGLWAQRQHAEREAEAARQRQAVEAALDKANELRQQARWAEARAILEQTRDRLGESGPDDLRQRVHQADAELALADRLEGIRLKLAAASAAKAKLEGQTAQRQYATAFREAHLGEEGQPAEAVATRIRASAVREHLVAALDDWAAWTADPQRRAWLLEVARRSDPDPWRDRCRDPKVWGDRAALQKLADDLLREETKLKWLKPPLLTALGNELRWAGGDAVPLLVAAQAQNPGDFWLNFRLGIALGQAKRWNEAVGYYRAALAIRPDSVSGHINLGNAQAELGRGDEAIREYRTAIALDPKHALAHYNLGNALRRKGQVDEAIREFQETIALDPKLAPAHNALGSALRDKKQADEAIREFQEAIALDPENVSAHSNLGAILCDVKRDYDGAIACFRTAIALDPKLALLHSNLGNALWWTKQMDEAIREYRAAVALDPKHAPAHNDLGNALMAQKQVDEAVKAYRAALALDPKRASAHGGLSEALRQLGRFTEARVAAVRCLELLPPGHPRRSVTTRLLHECEQAIALEQRLVVILEGKAKPADDAERLTLAWLCQQPYQRRYDAAARFYTEAFAHDPRLADDLRKAQHRYNAACAAALAGCGFGKDDPAPDEAAKAKLRRQALDWLRADLTVYAQLQAGADPKAPALVRQRMEHWQKDADFRGVRGDDALAKLPEAERQAWRELWANVAALLKKTAAGQ